MFTVNVIIKGKLIASGNMLSCYLLTLEGSVCKGTKDRAPCTLVICYMNNIFFLKVEDLGA